MALGGERRGHRLLDSQGRTAAWIEGGFGNGNWRIIHPRAYPVPAPVPDLETAKRRARDMALWALPLDRQAVARVRAKNELTVDPADLENPAALFQRKTPPLNLLGGYRFERRLFPEPPLFRGPALRASMRLGCEQF